VRKSGRMRHVRSLVGLDTSPHTQSPGSLGQMGKNYYADHLVDKALVRDLDNFAIEQAIVHFALEVREAAGDLTRY
jgi:hypothetical protein